MSRRDFGTVTRVLPTREQESAQVVRGARARRPRWSAPPRRYHLRITTTPDTPGERAGALRGAGVEADFRRVGRVALWLFLVALAVVVVGLYAAGAQKNAQITALRLHGVVVVATSTGCQGLLGGSGSNAAGYSCRGTYDVGGRRYDELMPGDVLHDPGTTFRIVAATTDPTLLATPSQVRGEHASWEVFALPTVLLAVLAGLLLVLGLRRRRLLRR